MLQLVDIHTSYGKSQVLWGVSLKLDEGTIVGILGRNGMGKTTIINSIMGFIPPHRGKILIKGKDVTCLEPNIIANMGVALVPQGRRIFPSLSVKENLTIASRKRGQNNIWSLDKIYTLFPSLKARENFKGNLLSGGEQQMLSIGRALMTNPEILLMDEPSEGLAPLIVQELGGIIKELNKNGLSILLVEQNINLAVSLVNYIYLIEKGIVVYESSPEIFEKEEGVKEMYIGLSKFD